MYIYMFIHIKQKLQDTDNHRGYFQHRGDTGRRTRSIIAGKTVKSPQTVTSKVSTGVSKNLCQTRPRTVALSKKELRRASAPLDRGPQHVRAYSFLQRT